MMKLMIFIVYINYYYFIFNSISYMLQKVMFINHQLTINYQQLMNLKVYIYQLLLFNYLVVNATPQTPNNSIIYVNYNRTLTLTEENIFVISKFIAKQMSVVNPCIIIIIYYINRF